MLLVVVLVVVVGPPSSSKCSYRVEHNVEPVAFKQQIQRGLAWYIEPIVELKILVWPTSDRVKQVYY